MRVSGFSLAFFGEKRYLFLSLIKTLWQGQGLEEGVGGGSRSLRGGERRGERREKEGGGEAGRMDVVSWLKGKIYFLDFEGKRGRSSLSQVSQLLNLPGAHLAKVGWPTSELSRRSLA